MPSPHILIIGAPGSGKTSQAQALASKLRVIHIDGSRFLRSATSAQGTDTKRAMLNIFEAIQHNARGGFVLSGCPKTIGQAKTLDYLMRAKGINFGKVIFLIPPIKVLKKRMKARKREGENEKRRYNKIKGFKQQVDALEAFYHSKGVLVEMTSQARFSRVGGKILNIVIQIEKAHNLRERFRQGRLARVRVGTKKLRARK